MRVVRPLFLVFFLILWYNMHKRFIVKKAVQEAHKMQGITATPCTLKEILQEVIADLKARTEAANYSEEVNDHDRGSKSGAESL